MSNIHLRKAEILLDRAERAADDMRLAGTPRIHFDIELAWAWMQLHAVQK
jgi:hypothetical protein